MLAKRIIPCLDVHAGRVTRGRQFGRAELGELADVGDPVALAMVYNDQGADELVMYDITATSEGRGAILDVAARVAERCFMPLTVGGGVRGLADMRALMLAGADKVSINSGAIADPELLTRAADQFGSQAVVLSIDVRARSRATGSTEARGRSAGAWDVYAAGGRRETGLDMLAWAEKGAALGAGEIVLNSIDGDGMNTGYDLEALRALRAAVSVPVVASGGAGNAEDMRAALLTGVDAALAAGIFHRGEVSVAHVKRVCAAAGLPMREVAA
ncbi:MAG: imidazole glycerol phosphate synthase subunit HisF [Trueperaceae bacterium]|nr:imidazole glycerol phosphate synthase subunit HisF [Trueperaceae bacterium]MCO5172636.1 imidazole glycerol phosphate synthase subunit HisF [Trueperaceae bacterium]